MIELTDQQRQELDSASPVQVRDPATNEMYVLVRMQTFARLQTILGEEDGWAESAYPAAMEAFARDGWDDPRMDVYDQLGPRKPS